MGLFSKLFSRENEPADKAQEGAETKAPSDGKEQDAQSQASRAEQAPAAKAEPPPQTSSREPLEEQPTTRYVAQSLKLDDAAPEKKPVAEAAAPVGPPQPAAAPKRDEARAAPPPLAASKPHANGARTQADAAPAPVKMAPMLKRSAAGAEPAKAAEPAKKAAAAPRPAPAPAQKAAPPPRGATEEPSKPKRTTKTTQRGFAPPIAPSAPEPAAGQGALEASPAARVREEAAPQAAAVQPLDAEVDAAVDTLLEASASKQRSSASDEAADQRAVAETFAAMIKVNAHPLRDFMFQLSVGRTPRQWAAACRPFVRPLFDASKQLGEAELAGALLAFDAALERAAGEASACIGDANAGALEQAYARMHGLMPDAFAPLAQADGRKLVLLESLLLQVPALHRRTLDKFYAAGLNSLAQLSRARPDELAAVTGVDLELAQAVVDHVQRFERERSRIDATALRSHFHERLRAVARRLEQLQAEFERAEQEESNVRKRAARRGREAAVLELELLFAELGDLDLVEELKRSPVRGKIKRVESYLERLPASA